MPSRHPHWPTRWLARAAAAAAVCATVGCMQYGPQVPTYVVFFNPDSTSLDAPANSVITDAATAAATVPGRKVYVAGYADAKGTPQALHDLTLRRAQAVAAGLTAQGVAGSRIVLEPKGHDGGDVGIESRRVEIEF